VLVFDSSSSVRSVRDTNVVICVFHRTSELPRCLSVLPLMVPCAAASGALGQRTACLSTISITPVVRIRRSSVPPFSIFANGMKDSRDETEWFRKDSGKARYSADIGFGSTQVRKGCDKRDFVARCYTRMIGPRRSGD